jgi:SAM-dependent methyltransferase
VYRDYLSGFGSEIKDCRQIAGGRYHYFSKIIRKFFPQDRHANIIDIGCGRGEFLSTLRMCGYQNLLGVDNSEEQVFASNALNLNCIIKGDLLQFIHEQVSDSYDVVITFDVLEHLTKDEIFLVADGINRLLKPRGLWLIHVPNASSPFFGDVRYGDITHEIAFTQNSLRQLIFSCKFRKVKFYEDTPLVKNIKGLFRFLVWKLIRSILRFYLAAETGDVSNQKLLTQNILAVVSK